METAPDSLQQIQHVLSNKWPSFNDTVSWVSLVFGFLIYIIAYFAGGKQNKNKILFSIVFCIIIGSLCMPIFQKLELFLSGFLNENTSWIISMLLFISFISGIGINMYEIITVTAREAHPMSEQW